MIIIEKISMHTTCTYELPLVSTISFNRKSHHWWHDGQYTCCDQHRRQEKSHFENWKIYRKKQLFELHERSNYLWLNNGYETYTIIIHPRISKYCDIVWRELNCFYQKTEWRFSIRNEARIASGKIERESIHSIAREIDIICDFRLISRFMELTRKIINSFPVIFGSFLLRRFNLVISIATIYLERPLWHWRYVVERKMKEVSFPRSKFVLLIVGYSAIKKN